jgi:putative methionine-R-sulfoxide reductase with GAF domain
MHGSAQPGSAEPEDTSASVGPLGHNSNGGGALAEGELDSTLQLLVERAQYITGATGTALALPQGEEMVCRASAGSSAPAIGARLQVQSGLTGESISRRQLLRCDNAETDPRVNLEACRSLGIASIVVLPLMRRSGEIRGLFELFSDHPYAFEERDLIALERMAALTLTALDLAEQGDGTAPASSETAEMRIERSSVATPIASPMPTPPSPTVPPLPKNEIIGAAIKTEARIQSNRIESNKETPAAPTEPAGSHAGSPTASTPQAVGHTTVASDSAAPTQAAAIVPDEMPGIVSAPITSSPKEKVAPENESLALEQQRIAELISPPSRVPEAMRRVQKCASCGFPVSSGRTVCIDCERKELHDKELRDKEKAFAKKNAEKMELPEPKPVELQDKAEVEASSVEIGDGVIGDGVIADDAIVDIAIDSAPEASEQFVPAFLANSAAAKESWLSNHVNLLAIVVLIMAILVAVVVFR